ncbi:MAG: Ig-like domain-containing protein [Rhodoferax sp.]|nr:Ig-like domain-containing protein [Rhodoferax sp.]
MATVSDVTTVTYSGDSRVDSLLHSTADWNYLLPSRTTLFYTFDLSVIDPVTAAPLTAFNAAQQAAVTAILNHASSVTGITFALTASGAAADFHFGACDIAGATTAGLAQTSENYSFTGANVLTAYTAEAFIYLDNLEFLASGASPTSGSAGYEILLHEIGHALGLGHPFEGTFPLPPAQDNTNNTVMSYTHAGGNKTTFQSYDLLALRWLYGEDGLRGTWGFNSTNGPSLTLVGSGDTTAPTVSSFNPVDEATGVSLNANLVLTFSESIARGTGTIRLKTAAGGTVESYDAATSPNLSIAGSTLTVNPTFSLSNDTGYKLEFESGNIKDLAGNSFAGTTSYNFTTLASVNQPPTGAVQIAGTASQGQTLNAVTTTLADADGLGTLSYQWLRAGNVVAGSTSASYTLGQGDVGQTMTVRVSYTDALGTAESALSSATSTVANVNDAPSGSVVIAGQATEGQLLVANTSLVADPDGLGAFSCQWLRNATPITGATSSNYLVAAADIGATLSARVSYLDAGGTIETLTSGATASVTNANDPPTGAVTLVGTFAEEQTLSANTSTLADADGLGTLSYQWLRGGAPIAGGTNSSYQLTASDVGAIVNVRVSYTDGFGHAEQVTSTATTPVADGVAPTALSFSPVDEAIGVGVDANIVVTFSEPIARGAGLIVLKTAAGLIIETFSVASSLNLSFNGAALTLNPTVSLSTETVYQVEFPSGAVADLAGNSFTGTNSYNFTTIAAGHALSGTALADTLLGTAGSDTINAGAGNDTVTGAGGDDTVDGGEGTDTAVFAGPRAAYTITRPFGVLTAVADGVGTDGRDALSNVERLKFADLGVALDLDAGQAAGQAALLVGAVLGVGALTAKKPLVGAVIDLIDQGFSFQVLAGAVMRLEVWGVLANGGAAGANNTQIASYLLTTVNGSAPDALTLNAAVAALDTETGDAQGNFLWHLAESAANQTQINLVGLVETGLEFGGT